MPTVKIKGGSFTCAGEAGTLVVSDNVRAKTILLRRAWTFAGGQPIEPMPELLAVLSMLSVMGMYYDPVSTAHNLIAYRLAWGVAMVQYPVVDDPVTGVQYELVRFTTRPWPCLEATVLDGGSLGIWPESVRASGGHDTELPTKHRVCLTHLQSRLDPDWSDTEVAQLLGRRSVLA